ncbi:MAG: XRE family transcriptional regulator [Myxococcales bacterium]|nr:XRE family transcriptional regulator [Myxococcales bacterium]
MPRRPEDRVEAGRIARRLGSRLRAIRLSLHWTQDQLSERIGVTSEAYARIERGLSLPSFPTLMRLCDMLNVGPDTLLVAASDDATWTPRGPASTE